jgi:hypothetical protein
VRAVNTTPAALDALISTLKYSPDRWRRLAAINAIGPASATPFVISNLASLVTSPDSSYAIASLKAIGRIGLSAIHAASFELSVASKSGNPEIATAAKDLMQAAQ